MPSNFRWFDPNFGVMVESHLIEGRQDIIDGTASCYGQSVTDACLGWSDSEQVFTICLRPLLLVVIRIALVSDTDTNHHLLSAV